ncbi:glycoside hydrolase family 43 protein [Sphingosinicella terrae]|uniref:glycoside hydrolase family 43 protein n=1 Tax=Sphingosinicella terrae TaxID=2172047 RepID=UPI000E0D4F8D|nr:glycoside hydrolase family 43 protein [Sphingosinicella terrae]
MRKLLLLALALLAGANSAQAEPPFVPVFSTDFPDPFVLPHDGAFLAYATNAQGHRANVQMARSTNLVDWQLIERDGSLHDAMPTLPPWAREGFTWAPEVIAVENGFVLHFTAKDRRSELQCLGAAFSADPLGPFVSEATEPVLCQAETGGTIDSHAFRDADGQLYLYYKNDGNNPRFGLPTDIFVQRLSPDGLQVIGDPVALLRNDTDWEAHVIEAPTMVRRGDSYILFFSANHFGWETHQRLSPYSIGYARCSGPVGPCTDAAENPILHSYNDREAGCLSGPGHQSVFELGGRHFISFHAWAATRGCRRFDNRRYMYIAPLGWDGDTPRIAPSLRPGENG